MPKQPKVTYYPIKTTCYFLRSGQACTVKPGVATEFRKTCIQEYFSGQGKHVLCHLVSQFTRTCSMTSVRHVLFPEHSRKSRPALFPPISLILIKSSRHTRKLISAQNRFNQSSCVKDRRLVLFAVFYCTDIFPAW